jgi:endoglucanase
VDVPYRNPDDVSTGGYGDSDCSDERLWAAAELWRSGGHAAAHQYFLARFASQLGALTSPAAWPQVAPLGLWSYALAPDTDAGAVERIREAALAGADAIAARSEAHAYGIGMLTNDYVWGSNGVAANYGVLLLIANQLREDPRYLAAALSHLHYLLGRNTFSLSWVTRLGANPFRNPHHRPSGADPNPEPWPGLLSGGPNRHRQDPALEALPPDTPPGRSYVDHQDSYASNENAINWNAPLVFLLAGLSR